MKDKTKLLHERALMTCVIMLFLCIILKLFGVRWFDLDTSIPILNKIDDLVMNNELLSFIYSVFLLSINAIFICLITTKEDVNKVVKRFHIILILIIFSMFVKRYVDFDPLSFTVDTIILYLSCTSVKKVSIVEYLLVTMINVIYQSLSLYIRDLGFHLAYYGLVPSLIFMIDYYLMLSITYLYLKKGEHTLCGIFHRFGSYLANQLWKRHTEDSQQSSESKER